MREVANRLIALVSRRRLEEDLEAELASHVAMAAEANERRGMTREEARRQALISLGGVEQAKEGCREERGMPLLETVLQDVRYGARVLRRSPGFTALVVLTLALGVGATTAIFSVVDPILFEPLPYPHARRIAAIEELASDGSGGDGTFAAYRQFAERARSLEAIAVFRPWHPAASGAEKAERFDGQRVSAEYFRLFGARPAIGRVFAPADDLPGAPEVVIVSDSLWRRRFAADPAIVGREIRLDDRNVLVVGVMPESFENVVDPSARLWTPLRYDPALPADGREWGHHLRTVARLAPGVSIERASREVDELGRAMLRSRRPTTYDPNTRFRATSLSEKLTRGVRPALLAIFGAAFLVLVIACENVTNLMLARSSERRGEFALRLSLGAGRARLIRQLLTESLLLSLIGGTVGIVVARVGVRALAALRPANLARAGAIAVNGAVFAFGFGITVLVGLAFGVIPALQAARSEPKRGLDTASRRTTGGGRFRSALVVAEVALSLVLLVGSGLLLRSLARLFAVDAGFDPSRLLTLQVQTNGRRFTDDRFTNVYYRQALEAVRRVPGVEAAGLTSQLALSGDRDIYGVKFEADPTRPEATYGAFRYAVSPGYLETMRIPLHRGRLFDDRDGAEAPRVALVSRSLAAERFGAENPIGHRLSIGPAGPYTIIGVVGDVRQVSLAFADADAVYTPSDQWFFADGVRAFVVRSRGDAAALSAAVERAIRSVDKDQPISRVATMPSLVEASAAERRFALILFEAFGLAALMLSAAGLYGVLAGRVAEKTREIGIRSALGASRGEILRWVYRGGMSLTALGMAIGLAGAAAASRAIAAMLFGISRLDPLTYVGVVALLAAVSAAACGVPAWRAARVDPATTLRAE